MTKEQFMKLTIASHNLPLLSEQDAAEAAPSESAMRFAVLRGEIEKPADKSTFLYSSGRARFLRKKTDYFELKGKLVSSNDWFYPPLEAFEKSFDKWLALQTHDVKAVNSLYQWREAVDRQRDILHEELYDLEEVAMISALKPYVESTLARKEKEDWELTQLYHDIGVAIDKVRASSDKRKAA